VPRIYRGGDPVSALDNAKAVVENPFGVSHRETIKALRRLIAEHERVLAERAAPQEWEYRYVVEGWKDSPDRTFRASGMWTTRESAESSRDWQRARIGEELEWWQPHITAAFVERRRKPGEPEPLPEDANQTEGENR
jgi:hypothetical protein